MKREERRYKGIRSEQELAVTRKKLGLLEERVATLKSQEAPDAHLRELTLRSLMSTVNQLREEIARYTAGSGAQSAAAVPSAEK